MNNRIKISIFALSLVLVASVVAFTISCSKKAEISNEVRRQKLPKSENLVSALKQIEMV